MKTQREGMALTLVVLLMLVLGSIATGAAMIGSNTWLMAQYKERQSTLAMVADAGLEEGRARLNGNKNLYPDSNYNTIENGVQVRDALGTIIPGVRRWTYVGPIGVTTGQYGVFGSVVSVAEAGNGDRVIRRLEVMQESFAKYAYFTDIEPSTIAFGGGDQLFGPVHSNDDIQIYNSGATFHGPVTTGGTITGRSYGTFRQGYTERVRKIPMPATAELDKLRAYAQNGGTAFVSSSSGGTIGQAKLRIEFIAVDLNGDGETTGDDEGFLRVFRGKDNSNTVAAYVVGAVTGSSAMRNAKTCGHYHRVNGVDQWWSASEHGNSGSSSWSNHLNPSNSGRRCFPGGHPGMNDNGAFRPSDINGNGEYLEWNGAIDPRVSAARAGIGDANYLFPLSRKLNPGFKGVVFVDGKVAIMGTLRARITLAATNNIIIIDDVTYSVDPGAGACTDILGIFSGTDVVISDNPINSPAETNGSTYYTWDDTGAEFVHGVVLALQNFEVENYDSGSSRDQPCESTNWGRGCLYLTGGIIQSTRGAVGTSAGTGYLKRYSYDPCAFTNPPPYFPTTGHFARARLLEIDPTGFNITELFDLLTPDS